VKLTRCCIYARESERHSAERFSKSKNLKSVRSLYCQLFSTRAAAPEPAITEAKTCDTIPSTSEQTEKYTKSLHGQLTPHVVFSSAGFGDGCYPVCADVIEAPGEWPRVTSLRIVFVDRQRACEESEVSHKDWVFVWRTIGPVF
jgi:hypothetical protein